MKLCTKDALVVERNRAEIPFSRAKSGEICYQGFSGLLLFRTSW
jgi:hypothetical protein